MYHILEFELEGLWTGVQLSQTLLDDMDDSFINFDCYRALVKSWIIKSVQKSEHAFSYFIFESKAVSDVILWLRAESFFDGPID